MFPDGLQSTVDIDSGPLQYLFGNFPRLNQVILEVAIIQREPEAIALKDFHDTLASHGLRL